MADGRRDEKNPKDGPKWSNSYLKTVKDGLFGKGLFVIPILCVGFMAAGIFGPLVSDNKSHSLSALITGVIGIVTAMAMMLQYLQGSRNGSAHIKLADEYRQERELRNLQIEIASLLANPSLLKAKSITERERADVLTDLRKSVQETLKEELATEFESRYSEAVIEQVHLKSIRTMFDSTRERLLEEITSLGRRGNLNLVLGSMTSLVGLFALGYVVFMNSDAASSAFMINHIPRITLILFIQLFGFFFLKLYRSSLESIKYFQNELTNVELRFIAINASIMSGNEKSLASIVSTFSKTERNFLLQKGQTTVEIEKTRLDNEKNDDIVAVLSDVIKKTTVKTN